MSASGASSREASGSASLAPVAKTPDKKAEADDTEWNEVKPGISVRNLKTSEIPEVIAEKLRKDHKAFVKKLYNTEMGYRTFFKILRDSKYGNRKNLPTRNIKPSVLPVSDY